MFDQSDSREEKWLNTNLEMLTKGFKLGSIIFIEVCFKPAPSKLPTAIFEPFQESANHYVIADNYVMNCMTYIDDVTFLTNQMPRKNEHL